MNRLTGKWTAPLIVAALGFVLFLLPRLGSFGLWDPSEVRIADVAKEVVTSPGGVLASKTIAQRPAWLVVAGFKSIGATELGGRLPIALVSIVALLACYYVGEGLLRRRGALLGALALATCPAFFLGARQLTTSVGPTLAMLLAIGGLGRAAWPKAGGGLGRRLLDLAVGIAGLVLGFYASGMMIGVATPLTAVAIALAFAGGPMLAWLGSFALAAIAWGVEFWAWRRSFPSPSRAGEFSQILAGVPHAGMHSVQLVSVLKQIGFGAFPWVTLLPLAVARAFATDEPNGVAQVAVGGPEAILPFREGGSIDDLPHSVIGVVSGPSRERFGQLLLLSWLVIGYLAHTLQSAVFVDLGFAALPSVALLAGGFLDEIMDGPDSSLGLAGLIVGLGAAVLAHDFFLTPEAFAGAHVVEGIKWPSPLTVEPFLILALGLGWGVVAGVGLALRPSKRLLGRQNMVWGSMGAALALTLATTFWIIPEVSKHLSFKNVFAAYAKLGGADSELGQYRVSSHPWGERKATELGGLPQLFAFLGKPTPVFALVGAEELAPIDQYAKSQPSRGLEQPALPFSPSRPTPAAPGEKVGLPLNAPQSLYYVVDDSNVHYLLLSNRLGKGEVDHNPLRTQIVKSLVKPPQHEVHADFEGKVELVGYDLPAELDRGRKFKITLYYKVNAPIPGAYKIFVHFDGPGTRFNGDHVPLEGKFPTNYWVPGYYIIDEHEMEPDRATAPAGWYQIYTGMWLGDTRLKVISGPQDGENRVKVGTVRVK